MSRGWQRPFDGGLDGCADVYGGFGWWWLRAGDEEARDDEE